MRTENSDLSARDIAQECSWPELFNRATLGRKEPPVSRIVPTTSGQIPQGCRRLARYHHLHVVKGSIGRPIGIESSAILRYMSRRVPSRLGQIQPSYECDRVVDDHHLLMVRGSEGMLAVDLV